MKEVGCYLCGADSGAKLFRQKGRDPYYEIVFGLLEDRPLYWCICKRCGFVYRSPVLEEKEAAKLYEHYEQNVFQNQDPHAYFDQIVGLSEAESENVQKTIWLDFVFRKHTGKTFFSGISVLDIGCGGGTLLYSIRKKMKPGNVCAVELNESYARLASEKLGVDVRNQPFRPGLFGRTFDLVVCTKVLEHVSDPAAFVGAIAQDMSADGILFMEVPDIRDLYTLPADHDRFYIPHVYFFSTNTMTAVLAKAGLEVLESRTTVTHRNRGYLQLIAKKKMSVRPAELPYDKPGTLIEKVALRQSGS